MDKRKYNLRFRCKALEDLTCHFTSSDEDSSNDDSNQKIVPTLKYKKVFLSPERNRIKLRPSIITRHATGFVSSTPMHSAKKAFNKSLPISPIENEKEETSQKTRRRSSSLQIDAVTSTCESFCENNRHDQLCGWNKSSGKILEAPDVRNKFIFPGNNSSIVSSNNVNNSLASSLLPNSIRAENLVQSKIIEKTSNSSTYKEIPTKAQARETVSTYAQGNLSCFGVTKQFKSVLTQTVVDKGTQITDSLEKCVFKTPTSKKSLLRSKPRKSNAKNNYDEKRNVSSHSCDESTLCNVHICEHIEKVNAAVNTSAIDLDNVGKKGFQSPVSKLTAGVIAKRCSHMMTENLDNIDADSVDDWLSDLVSQHLTDRASDLSSCTSSNSSSVVNRKVILKNAYVILTRLNSRNINTNVSELTEPKKKSGKAVECNTSNIGQNNSEKSRSNITLRSSIRNRSKNETVQNIENNQFITNENDVSTANTNKSKADLEKSSNVIILRNQLVSGNDEESDTNNGLIKKTGKKKSAKSRNKNSKSVVQASTITERPVTRSVAEQNELNKIIEPLNSNKTSENILDNILNQSQSSSWNVQNSSRRSKRNRSKFLIQESPNHSVSTKENNISGGNNEELLDTNKIRSSKRNRSESLIQESMNHSVRTKENNISGSVIEKQTINTNNKDDVSNKKNGKLLSKSRTKRKGKTAPDSVVDETNIEITTDRRTSEHNESERIADVDVEVFGSNNTNVSIANNILSENSQTFSGDVENSSQAPAKNKLKSSSKEPSSSFSENQLDNNRNTVTKSSAKKQVKTVKSKVEVADKENMVVGSRKRTKINKISPDTAVESSDSVPEGVRRSKRQRMPRKIDYQPAIILTNRKYYEFNYPETFSNLDKATLRELSKMCITINTSENQSLTKQKESERISRLKSRNKKTKKSNKGHSKTNDDSKIDKENSVINGKCLFNVQENTTMRDVAEDVVNDIQNSTEINSKVTQVSSVDRLNETKNTDLESQLNTDSILRNYFYFPQNNQISKIDWCSLYPQFGRMAKSDGVRMAVGPKSSYAGFQSGLIEIPAGKSKPRDMTKKYSLVFTVIAGKALFEVHDSYSYAERFAMVYVPLGAYYSIRNQSNTESLFLNYFQTKSQSTSGQ